MCRWILYAGNCEGTEQLRMQIKSMVMFIKGTVQYGFAAGDQIQNSSLHIVEK